ncbi:hypothetical protein [Geomonas silvestris]|uniref:hypothetical protein n=1 Tax=Geomonas silvestris TaxID=2740184 RepID=UPI0016137476|nr:hypothetical protein [Geomonas silvestris]
MALQNRTDPFGNIIATPERGTLMGNRGILHDHGQQLIRKSRNKAWVFCLLNWRGIRRQVMGEGRYTELFFLDEATAFAAGHRPCSDCQRDRFNLFKRSWISANSEYHQLDNPSIAAIDKILHGERIGRRSEKISYSDQAANVPEGAFISHQGNAYLKWKGNYVLWTFSGYRAAVNLPPEQEVNVLTPQSIVRCFSAGFVPRVHQSLDEY